MERETVSAYHRVNGPPGRSEQNSSGKCWLSGGVLFEIALVLLILNQFISKYAASFKLASNTTFYRYPFSDCTHHDQRVTNRKFVSIQIQEELLVRIW